MADYRKDRRYFAQIADGLETLGIAELSELGATHMQPVRRGIHFTADRAALYRINYGARLCSRILAPLKTFACHDARSIYRAAGTIDWTRYLGVDETFAVFSSTKGSTVPHDRFAGQTLKDALVDQFRDRFGRRPNVDPKDPDLWINLFVQKDEGTISVDTSGGSLHRRGYRRQSVAAPMQETVAAAMVRLSGWDGTKPLIDPMCGSGTLIIEAAMAHCRVPAGHLRQRFGFQRLPDYVPDVWQSVKTTMDQSIRKLPDRLIYASDIDPRAVSATRTNCRQFAQTRRINALRRDIFDIDALENQILLCNPPYGIRMQGGPELGDFYRRLGDFLKQRCTGSAAYIYFGNREMLKHIGLKPSWKRPLKNGGLDGRLAKYDIY